MLGQLKKMQATLGNPVQYQLLLSDQSIPLNPLLGQPIRLTFTGQIACVHCQRRIKKSFNQGYCYPCLISLAQCDSCIIKPETCHYHAGTCREPAWGEAFCHQPHIVYLANSSGIKVGITRQNQMPTRWLDQGAVQALPVFTVPSRYISGLVEVVFAKHVSDKTSWQQMLKMQAKPVDLSAKRDELLNLCADELAALKQQFGATALQPFTEAQPIDISFPVDHYPTKVKSFNFDKSPEVAGVLQGIKGQYLIFDTGVINIRKFTGYEVAFAVGA